MNVNPIKYTEYTPPEGPPAKAGPRADRAATRNPLDRPPAARVGADDHLAVASMTAAGPRPYEAPKSMASGIDYKPEYFSRKVDKK